MLTPAVEEGELEALEEGEPEALEEGELEALEEGELEALEEAALEEAFGEVLEGAEEEELELEEAEDEVLEGAEEEEAPLDLPWQELWKLFQASSALPFGHLLSKQLWILLDSPQIQPTSFIALHLLELLETSATQANKQAGGVANTWLLKRAKAIEPRTVDVCITNVSVRIKYVTSVSWRSNGVLLRLHSSLQLYTVA